MQNIYIDESGDPSMSLKSSDHFVLTAFTIPSHDSERLQKEMRKLLKSLLKIDKNRIHYFHAYKEKTKVKKDILKILERYDYRVVYKVFYKKKDGKYKENLNYKSELITFLENLQKDGDIESIKISKYDTRKYILNNIKDAFSKKEFKIDFELAEKDLLLQVADLCSWIVFQKYERGAPEYYLLCRDIERQNP